MNWATWFAVISICLLGAMSPGPSLALVLKHTLNGGRRQGMVAGFAHGIGIGIYALATVLGIAALLAASPAAFTLVQWAGALFLAYLGVKGLVAARAGWQNTTSETQATNSTAARDGFLMACLNPYAAIFFLALFSQFISANTPFQVKMLYAITAIVIDMGWYMAVAWFFSRPLWLARLQHYTPWLERVFSIALLGFAVKLVLA